MNHYKRSGYVWLVSAAALGVYALLGLTGASIPGIQEFTKWLNQAQGWEFMVAGFVAILLEGLYVIGNFTPGTTTVILLAILLSVGSWWQFFGTLIAVFVGWCIAGALNILFAYYSFRAGKSVPEHVFIVHDNLWLTWLPNFRANYEVSQIAAGGDVRTVLFSAFRVRFMVSLIVAILATLTASMIALESIDNDKGFISLLLVVLIMIVIGVHDIRKAARYENTN